MPTSSRIARVPLRLLDVRGMWPFADFQPPGLPPPGDGDAHLLRPDRPSAVHMAPQALHLHLGEPDNSKVAIWHEGMGSTVSAGDSSNISRLRSSSS